MCDLKRCWACGSEPKFKRNIKMSGVSESVRCSNEDCWVSNLSVDPEDWNKRFEESDYVKQLEFPIKDNFVDNLYNIEEIAIEDIR